MCVLDYLLGLRVARRTENAWVGMRWSAAVLATEAREKIGVSEVEECEASRAETRNMGTFTLLFCETSFKVWFQIPILNPSEKTK